MPLTMLNIDVAAAMARAMSEMETTAKARLPPHQAKRHPDVEPKAGEWRRAGRSGLDGWRAGDASRPGRFAAPGLNQRHRCGFGLGRAGAVGARRLDCRRRVLRQFLDDGLVDRLAETSELVTNAGVPGHGRWNPATRSSAAKKLCQTDRSLARRLRPAGVIL